MNCKKCGSDNVTVQYSEYEKSKRRSVLWNLMMILLTGGFWIVWILLRNKKTKTVKNKYALCQDCGNSWKL